MPKIDDAEHALEEIFGKATDKETIDQYAKVKVLLEDAKKEESDLRDSSAKLLTDYRTLVVTGVKAENPHEDGEPIKPLSLDECAEKVLNKGEN